MYPRPELAPRRKCPNCGLEMPATQPVCENCGYQFVNTTDRTVERVVTILLLVFIGVPAALFGGCVLLMSAGDPSGLGFALVPLAIFGLLLWLTIRAYRPRGPR